MGRALVSFGRVVTAMATPFKVDSSVDYEAISVLATHLKATGTTAIVSTGTTGEAGTLTDPERVEVWRKTVEATDLPVIVGSGSNDTAHSAELTKLAKDLGAKGVLAVVPYYSRPSQEGIFGHFAQMAEATDLPIVIYDIPIRTGRKLEHGTLLRLAERYPHVCALKDATGEVANAAQLIADASEDFTVYSGDDSLTLPFMSVGAVGVVGVATHWAGQFFSAMIDAFEKGDVGLASEINRVLGRSYRFESQSEAPNPIPTKAMIEALGLSTRNCRLPISDPSDELVSQAEGVLLDLQARSKKLGIVFDKGVGRSWPQK